MLSNLGVKITPGFYIERPKYLVETPLALERPVVLASRYTEGPKSVTLDAKGRKCGWFVLRHAAKWTIEPQPAFKVIVAYEDGAKSEADFLGGVNVRDLDDPGDMPFSLERETATVADTVKTETPLGVGFVYETVWPNENPGKKITSVRIESANHSAAAIMGFALANESNALEGVARGNKVLCDSLASEGSKLQEEKRYAEAIAKYEQAHSADPRQLYVMNALGNCFQKLNDQKSAEMWYLKSLRTDINQPPVWDWLKSTGSTATLDDSGTQRKSLSAPTLVVADLTFSTDGGATWTADPPILSGTNWKFKVKAEWAGGDSRCGGVQLRSLLESTNGKERYDHVDFKRAYYYAYRHLHQTPRPYIFDMDLSGRNPGTYKYRFRVWYNINEPDPTLPGEDKRRVEANRAFSVLIRK
jgi:tetratricopeptide (TPR) repeat protein